MRVDKFLSNMGIGTRTEIKKQIKYRKVTVNGEVVNTGSFHIDPEKDDIRYLGNKIEYKKNLYIMMNKPSGYVSATDDKRDPTVLDIISGHFRKAGLNVMGRLDKDTEGLLILTDDGDLIHEILSPKKHVAKVYYAKIDGCVTEEDVQEFSKGININNEYTTKPSELKIINSGDISEIELKIFEGKYHQVKRMFLARGKKVIYLKRIQIGDIYLDENLKLGEFRELTENELKSLKK
jgi:16S rRNA pseudouridine516 synthase